MLLRIGTKLFCFFAAVLWQFKVDQPEVGESRVRIVDSYDPILKGRAGANLVFRGIVATGMTAGKSAVRDRDSAYRIALVALEHFPIA